MVFLKMPISSFIEVSSFLSLWVGDKPYYSHLVRIDLITLFVSLAYYKRREV
ncbi:hypothetical protein HanIR_Chr13g0627271 [Helianthus annuus]|nr:hypothetical protein HanIR_Chr13g0627271 [Helianthus annuus]